MNTSLWPRRILAAAALASLVAAQAYLVAGSDDPQATTSKQTPKKTPYAKLAQPWPSEEVIKKRHAASDALPLFASDEVLPITIAADFRAVNKDRDPASTQRFPGELRTTRPDGRIDVFHIKLGTRGHFRLMPRNCDFVPLRVEFVKDELKGTVFAGQSWLKLGTHCQDSGDYEQYVLKEYLAYKMFNLLTQKSFRVRLVKGTYVDSKSGKAVATRYGVFLEHDNDVARRMEGRIIGIPRVVFADLDQDTLTQMMVFEYMVGNTDFSIFANHNVRLVQTPDRKIYPVPYDFDISGLVHPPYATPARGLMITSVMDRLYRGPCRTPELINPILANFLAKKDPIMALWDSLPDMKKEIRREVKDYVEDFYSTIKSDRNVRRLFIDGCRKAEGM
jgi:hypothetical protein